MILYINIYFFKVASITTSLANTTAFRTLGFTKMNEMRVYTVRKNATPEAGFESSTTV